MNGYIYISFYMVGLLSFLLRLIKNKTSIILIIAMCLLFVCSAVSRQYGYKSYSDLGAYLVRFKNDDNSYFSAFYGGVTKVISFLLGKSTTSYLIGISSINLLCAIITSSIIQNKLNRKPVSLYGKGKNTANIFIFLYGVYWGVSFSAEVIRSGLAISISLIVIALLLCETKCLKIIVAVILYILSLLMHWTQIILLPFIIGVLCSRKPKYRGYKFYIVLTLILLFLELIDFGYLMASIVTPIINKVITIFGMNEHYDVYLIATRRTSMFDYVTLQYVYYHILGVFFASQIKKQENYIKLLNGYYYGLAIFTVSSGVVIATTRLQWPLLILSIFLMYSYLTDDKYSKSKRLTVGVLYSLTQMIMAIRYLGILF